MKTLHEKAKEFAKKECGYNYDCDTAASCEGCQWLNNSITENQMRHSAKGFVAGYSEHRHETRWRSVEEELPEDQRIVMVKTNKNSFATAYLHGKSSGFITYGDTAYIEFGRITHWRPID